MAFGFLALNVPDAPGVWLRRGLGCCVGGVEVLSRGLEVRCKVCAAENGL